MEDFVRSWRRATSAELAWIDGAGRPAALTSVPLLAGGGAAGPTGTGGVPCVALTYDRADVRVSLASAGAVAFAITDARSLPPGTGGVAALGRVTVEDVPGEDFGEELLEQELHKYPPARTLADSLLLRRENWWYLPRVVVRLDRAERTLALPARRDAGRDALLVRDDGSGLRLDVVGAQDWSAEPVALRAGTALRGDGAPALAHGHDHSPDRERWETWRVAGELREDTLHGTVREGRPGLEPGALRLLERLRRARALERGCRRGLRLRPL